MTFAGLKNDPDRANVIAWLRTLADSPPLPHYPSNRVIRLAALLGL